MNEFEIAGLCARELRNCPLVDAVQECLTRDNVPYAKVTIDGEVFVVMVQKAKR